MDNSSKVNQFGDMLSANTLNDLKIKVNEQVNNFRENLGYDLYDKLKIGLIGIISASIILGIIFFIYKKVQAKYLEPRGYYLLENIATSDPNIVPDCEVVSPQDGYNFSIHIKMYIENYYSNYGSWRHVFHKGTQLENGKVLDYIYNDEVNDSWDEVLADIPKQTPGLWLHPNSNTLRFVLETEYDTVSCADTHADTYTSLDSKISGKKKPAQLESAITKVQFMDIPDIPVQTDVDLTFVINSNNVTVYYNGKMRNIFTFKGKPIVNKGPLYFHAQKSYGGMLKKFYFFPKKITDEKIKALVNE
jgi:hypothetical protein